MNVWEKKMTLIAFVFPKLRTPKRLLDKCLKSTVSEDPSRSNTVSVPKHCWNQNHSTFIIFIHDYQVNLVEKSLSLLTCQIFALLLNTLAADEKYPVLNRDNLTIPIQMQLSRKQKTFSQFFAAFLKSSLKFKSFGEKDDRQRFR